MRVSQDSSSWKAGGVLRRDFRHSHDGPEVARHRRRRGNTRRWCRGEIGRDHHLERYVTRWVSSTRVDPDTGEERTVRHPAATALRCARCGRTDVSRLPLEVRAAHDPLVARHFELAARWCTDGHLFDVMSEPGRLDFFFGWYTRPTRMTRACVMCGLVSSTRVVAVDDPTGL
jgi:hypothetical protein